MRPGLAYTVLRSMTDTAPTVSIVVPVYKVEEYLAECLDSLLAQTDPDWELIAVNDGSPDGSPAILEQYAARNARIRVIHQENAGVAVARNRGVEEARGRYIVHVDADDQVHPQLLEVCRSVISRHEPDIISYGHLRVAPHTRMPQPTLDPGKLPCHCARKVLPLLRQRGRHRISLMAVMSCYRAELARAHPFLPGIKYDDYPYVATVVGSVHKAACLRVPLYGYTVRPGSAMTSNFAAGNIAHHRRALLAIADAYASTPRRLATVTRIIMPEILKQIGNSIFRSDRSTPDWPEMLVAFRSLLVELDGRGLLRWRGHKLRRYRAYRRLVAAAVQDLPALVAPLSRVFR